MLALTHIDGARRVLPRIEELEVADAPRRVVRSRAGRAVVLELGDVRLVENALVRVFAGRSSRGELLAECAGTACSGRKYIAWCGRLHVQYAANMSISNVTIEAADDDALGGAAAANNASAGDDDALVDDDDDEPDGVESVRARFAPWRNRFSASIYAAF